MCGRFTAYYSWQELHDLYDLSSMPQNIEPRYNVAPTQAVDVIRPGASGFDLARMTWGLKTRWSVERKMQLINVTDENLRTKRTFKSALEKGRCVVPASGFYEWRKEGKVRQPYHIKAVDDGILSLAGLSLVYRPNDGDAETTCAIITTSPNKTVEPIHNRMPAILDRDEVEAWLGYKGGPDLLMPCPDEWLKIVKVSTYVNNVKNQGPECVERVG